MKPYAYAIPDYDDGEIFPTREAVVASLKQYNTNPARYVDASTSGILACYTDGRNESVDLLDFIETHEVNEQEVAAYIDHMREEARRQDQEADEKRRAEGKPIIIMSGSCPIYMMDRDSLIENEIAKRKYSWK